METSHTGRVFDGPGGVAIATFCAVAAAALAACGFHLEGRVTLPPSMHSPYVQAADRQSDFVQSLRKAMLIAGARPVENKEQSSAVVNVLKDKIVQRVLSVSATNQPNEYELTYTVRFSVSHADQDLLAPQDVSATRTYSFDESLLLAKEHEEDILRQAMAHDLADIVMRRLSNLPAT